MLSGAAIVVSLPLTREAVRLTFASPPASYTVPVRGVAPSGLRDDWREQRTGFLDGWRQILEAGRQHRSLDIESAAGTPVVAATEGLVLSVGDSVIRILGPGGQVHTYANVRPESSLTQTRRVAAGDLLGHLLATEAGEPTHLRYGVYALPGFPKDPYLLLTQGKPPLVP